MKLVAHIHPTYRLEPPFNSTLDPAKSI